MNAPGAQRNPLIRDRVAEIRQAIEEAKAKEVTLADLGAAPRLPGESLKDASTDQELTPLSGPPAIDLPGLERLLLSVAATARFFAVHPAIPGAYLLDLGDGADRSVYRHLGSPATEDGGEAERGQGPSASPEERSGAALGPEF